MDDAPEDSPIPLSPEFAGFIDVSKYGDVVESIAWELNDQQKQELLQSLQEAHPEGLEFEQLNEEIDNFSNRIDAQIDLDPAPELDEAPPKSPNSELDRQLSPNDLEVVDAEDDPEPFDDGSKSDHIGHPAIQRIGEEHFEDWGGSQMLIDLSTPPPEPATSAAASANGKPPLPPDVSGNLHRGSEIRVTWPRHRSRPASLGVSGGGEASPGQCQSPSSRSPRSSARCSPSRRLQRRLSAVQLAQQLFSSSSGRSSPRNVSLSVSGGVGGMSDADLAAIEMAAQFNDHMTDQLRVLTDQVSKLTSTQTQSDSRQSRLLEDNQQLRERLLRLEDEYRDAEARFARDREADKARAKEKYARLAREKDEEIESLLERLRRQDSQTAEHRQEAQRLRTESERLRLEAARLEEKLEAAEQRLTAAKEESERAREVTRRELDGAKRERDRAQAVLEELQAETEALRAGTGGGPGGNVRTVATEAAARYAEVEQLARRLTQENRCLREQLEELQADLLARGLEEGRALVNGGHGSDPASLAAEIDLLNKEELMDLLVREKDATQKLRSYIDRILLKIMEKQPELLEIGMAS